MLENQNILKQKTIIALFKLSMPIFVGMISHVVYHNVDLYFVGKISSSSIASVAFVYPISFLFYGFLNGIGTAMTSIVGNKFGASNFKDINNISRIGTSFLLVLGLAYFLIIFFFGKNILNFIGVPESLLNQTYRYLSILSISSIFDAYNISARSIYTGKANAKTPMLIISLGAIINIILDPIFIYFFGFIGAAIATTASNLILFIIFFILVKKYKFIDLGITSIFNKNLFTILKIGIPASLTMIIISFGSMIYNFILRTFSIDAVAAVQINTRIEDVFFLFVISVSYSAMTLISMFIGAKDYLRLKLVVYQTLAINIIFGISLSLIFYNYSYYLSKLFTKDINVINISVSYFKHISFIYPIIAFGLSAGRIMQGFGTSIPMLSITSVRVLLVGIPLAYYFTYSLNKSINYVWYSMIISSIIASFLALLWLISFIKKH